MAGAPRHDSARRFARDRRGNVAILAGMAMLVMTGAGSIMADLGRAYMLRAELQATADAAALAAAARLPDERRATAMAIDYAAKNLSPGEFGQVLRPEDVVFGAWNPETRTLEPSSSPNAVRVTLRMSDANGNPMQTSLAGVIGLDALDLEQTATAGRRGAPCVMALAAGDIEAARMEGNADLRAYDCGLQVNATSDEALQVDSSATLMAAGICVTGKSQLADPDRVAPEPTDNCPPLPDPLAHLEMPAASSCAPRPLLDVPLVIKVITPGTYCGGLEIKNRAIVHFSPGVYVFRDGPLKVSGGATIRGSGVSFLFTGEDAVLELQSGAQIELTAPTDGTMQGMLVFQDPRYGGEHVWDSERPAKLVGTIYLPNGDFLSSGKSGITPVRSCNVLIARTILFKKGSGMSIDLGSADCQKSLPAALSRTTTLL